QRAATRGGHLQRRQRTFAGPLLFSPSMMKSSHATPTCVVGRRPSVTATVQRPSNRNVSGLIVDGPSSTLTRRSHFSEADGQQVKVAAVAARSASATNNPE